MLHILFLILKIIGIIFLVILGIAIMIVGVVLFVPIRYRVRVETSEGLKGVRMDAKATWLFHLMSAVATYCESELDWQMRFGWKIIKSDGEETEKKEDADASDTDLIKKNETVTENAPKEVTVQEEAVEKEATQEKATQEKTAAKEKSASEKPVEQPKGKKSKEKKNWFEKIKCTIRGFCDKIKNVKEFLTDELHLQALLHLKNELVVLVRRIKPDKVKGYIRFGLEDPYDTGKALAVLSMLYPFYGEYVQIYPEFDKEIIEGDVFMKGRIHCIHLVIAICKLYFDDNVKTVFKNIKTLNG